MFTTNELLEKINRHISELKFTRQPEGLYEPVSYVLSLGGKRIRPLLMLMAYNLYKEDVELIFSPATGIEVYHNYTLVLAYQFMAACPSASLKEVLDLFSMTALEICEGQQMDMEFESRKDVSEAEYLEMIRLKTSVLLACSLKIGAVLAGASQEDADRLYDFGINLGVAFQLKDDLLDVYGNPEVFGKNIGGDILCNKKTYLLIKAFERADEQQRRALSFWIDADTYVPEKKITAVTALYDEIGVKNLCESLMEEYTFRARAALLSVAVSDERKQALKELMEQLMFREV